MDFVTKKFCAIFSSSLKLASVEARRAEAQSLLELSGKLFWLAIGVMVSVIFKAPEWGERVSGGIFLSPFISILIFAFVCVVLSICLRRQGLLGLDGLGNAERGNSAGRD